MTRCLWILILLAQCWSPILAFTSAARPRFLRCCFLQATSSSSSSSSTTTATPSSTIQQDAYKGSSDDFTQRLLDRLANNDTSIISVDAYVLSKRSLGKHLVFVDFLHMPSSSSASFSSTNGELVQAMLRGDDVDNKVDIPHRCLVRGAKFQIDGIASPTRNPGNVVLRIHQLRLLELPRQIQHVTSLLDVAYQHATFFTQLQRVVRPTGCCLPTSRPTKLQELARSILPDDLSAFAVANDAYPDAVHQTTLSRQGSSSNKNVVVALAAQAPEEWKQVPKCLVPLHFSSSNQATTVSRSTIQALLELPPEDTSSNGVMVSVSGWVQNRRRFAGNITQLSLVDDDDDNDDDQNTATVGRLPCLLHPNVLGDQAAGVYRNVAAVGAKVEVQGRVLRPDTNNQTTMVLWVEAIRLVRSSSRSVTIRHLLELLHHGDDNMIMDVEEVATALGWTLAEAQAVVHMDATQRQWMANALAVGLQQQASHGRPKVSSKLLDVMKHYGHIRQEHPVMPVQLLEKSHGAMATLEMPMGMPGSKWSSKKRPQLEWMGHEIQRVLQAHPDYGKRKLTILDIGGGKGSLANYLGKTMENVQVHVVDICQGAVANGESKANKLNLPVQFSHADATSDHVNAIPADMVVALHACGHLSDVALAHAVHRRVGFVIVPCCFNSNPHLSIPPVMAHQNPDVSGWLGIPAEDWAALKLLAEVQGDITLASQAIATICAVRAQAVKQKVEGLHVDVRSFPIEYSTRNIVLVGCTK